MVINSKRDLENSFRVNFPNCKVVRLSTYPKCWRHCCGSGGLQVLKPLEYNYYGNIVHYIYCGYCNQITYYMGG